jgi:glutaredoxin
VQKHVKLYTLSTCSHCRAAKNLLNNHNIDYEFIDVDLLDGAEREATIDEVKKLNPQCSFPTIIIGDKIIVGYREDEIREAIEL